MVALMSTHTPGPWTADWLKERGKYAGCTGIAPTAGPPLAYLPPGREDVQKANARLIAAAPDLLGAAKLALHEMCNTVAPRNSFTDAVDALDAAITKAEGTS